MTDTPCDISDLLPLVDGFPKPQWEAIGSRIEVASGPENCFAVWTTAVRQWLEAFCRAMGEGCEVVESEHFLFTLPPDFPGDAVLAFAERCRRRVFEVLPDISAFSSPGKEAVLLFGSGVACDRYLSSVSSQNDRFMSGAQVREGYPHIAAGDRNYAHLEETLAHELTHLSLCHLSTPAWIEEGLAQLVAHDMTGIDLFQTTTRAALDQKRYWRRNGLREFWNGDGFHRADDVSPLCYNLARILVRLLLTDFRPRWFGLQKEPQQRLCAFWREADRADAGEQAARDHLGFPLADLAARFLGPGTWAPPGPHRLAGELGYPAAAIQFVYKSILLPEHMDTHSLLGAIRSYATDCYADQAKATLRSWGVLRSEDVGRILAGLVREELLLMGEGDSVDHLNGQFTLDDLFPE